MPIFEAFEAVLDTVHKHAEKEKVREGQVPYWVECPGCGKRVVKKELLRKGCYVCGWHEVRNEAELAKIMCDSNNTVGAEEKKTSYRTNCPRCKGCVIRYELMQRGCHICGFIPQWHIRTEKEG